MNKWNIASLALMGVFVALSIVFTRLLVLPIGTSLRFTLGNIPILLSGVWFGPLAGAVIGFASDFLGTVLFPIQGAYMPIFAISPILMGVMPWFFKKMLLQKISWPRVGIMTLVCYIVSNMFWTTFCITVINGGGAFWELFIIRAPMALGMAAVDATVLFIVFKRVGIKPKYLAG